MNKQRRRRKPVDPEKLHDRTLRILEGVIEKAETDPTSLTLKGGMETVLKISEHLRRVNADLNPAPSITHLMKMSEADLDAYEASLKKGRG